MVGSPVIMILLGLGIFRTSPLSSLIQKGGLQSLRSCILEWWCKYFKKPSPTCRRRLFVFQSFMHSSELDAAVLKHKSPSISAEAFFRVCREDRIRTCDPLVPNQVRYRPALLPELLHFTKSKL